MAHSSPGKHRVINSNKLFAIDLGAGTSLKVAFSGKIGGKLNGIQLSGYGSLEYTYAQGASEWVRTDIDGSAQGPATIPVSLSTQVTLVYDPAGKCQAKVSIETDSDAMPETVGFKFKHKKDVWKMKGRTDLLTILVTQETGPVDPCDFSAAMNNPTFCADYEAAGSDGVSYCNAQGITDNSAGCADACGAAAAAAYSTNCV